MPAADGQGLEQRVRLRDRGEVQHRVVFHHTVIADIFAVGAFRLDQARRVQIALDDIRRRPEPRCRRDAFHHRAVARMAPIMSSSSTPACRLAARKSAGWRADGEGDGKPARSRAAAAR